MIDTPEKLKALRRSMGHAIDRLGPPEPYDVQSPIPLRDLILLFVRLGGRIEELYQLFAEADRPAVSTRKSKRVRVATTLVSPVVAHAGAR